MRYYLIRLALSLYQGKNAPNSQHIEEFGLTEPLLHMFFFNTLSNHDMDYAM